MFSKKGFTLVEILFVLIIMAGIVAYAVPAYRRSKERSNYEAALGILIDKANGIQSLQKDLSSAGWAHRFPRQGGSQLLHTGNGVGLALANRNGESPAQWMVDNSPSAAASDTSFEQNLFDFGYVNSTPSGVGYSFYAVNETSGVAATHCADGGTSLCRRSPGKTVVACMCLDTLNRNTGCYYGAKINTDGTIERFSASSCPSSF